VHNPLASRAPASQAGLPTTTRVNPALEPDQFSKLLAAMPERLHPIMSFLYYTGCRVGVAKLIQWSQVAFDGDKVEIRLTASQIKNHTPLTLPLPEELAAMLKRQFRKDGALFDSTNLTKTFRAAAVAVALGAWRDPKNHDAGYDGVLIHDLRRSGVRNLRRAGVAEDVAMKISGHKTRSVFSRYNIVDSSDVHEVMEKLRKYVAKRNSDTKTMQVPSKKSSK
jgi:integrase